jgi:lactoylglutathione lyase
MNISHIAFWVNDLEKMKDFYCSFFGGRAGANYQNQVKNFESCFVTFEMGVSIELMHKTNLSLPTVSNEMVIGIHHIAFSVGSNEAVDKLTSLLEHEGYEVKSNPRVTGDGYYESIVSDPEGNTIEIVG